MAHIALYRKWRPAVFEDIIGQSHITRTLKNQIMTNRIGHAYLFCGTRGTGKTTCAKVFSRAVNCLNPKDGSPCNECEICRGIADGSIMDVTELDAASNRKIDDVREIINDVAYAAAEAKYSVYIIDEVHMLTNEAFNALLKTLEEPPEHVIFILATTDPQKVPQTILSRCQRFDFKRISVNDIVIRLKEVAHGDGFSLTDDAYNLIARLGDGSMRDALSVLERVSSACADKITAQDIISVLGISARESVFDMTDAVIENNPSKIISVTDTLMNDGKDLNTFIDSLLRHFRDLMMCSVSADSLSLLDYGERELIRLKDQSSRITFEKLTRGVSVLAGAKADARWVKSPRIIYELALIRLARPETDSSPEAFMDKLASIEQRISSGRDEEVYSRLRSIEEKIKNGLIAAPEKKEEPHEQPLRAVGRVYRPFSDSELSYEHPLIQLARKWDSISAAVLKKAGYLAVALANRPITIDHDGIVMLYKRSEGFAVRMLDNNKDKLDRLFRQIAGGEYGIKYMYTDEVGDDPVNIWEFKPSHGAPRTSDRTEDNSRNKKNEAKDSIRDAQPSSDPLDDMIRDYGEIVEITDGTEFLEYSHDKEDFSQEDFFEDEDDINEEFLDSSELQSENE